MEKCDSQANARSRERRDAADTRLNELYAEAPRYGQFAEAEAALALGRGRHDAEQDTGQHCNNHERHLGNLGVGNETDGNLVESNNLTDTNTTGNSQ